jgi:hypothetical protein
MQIQDTERAGERRRQPPHRKARLRRDSLAKRNQQGPVARYAYPHVNAIIALGCSGLLKARRRRTEFQASAFIGRAPLAMLTTGRSKTVMS